MRLVKCECGVDVPWALHSDHITSDCPKKRGPCPQGKYYCYYYHHLITTTIITITTITATTITSITITLTSHIYTHTHIHTLKVAVNLYVEILYSITWIISVPIKLLGVSISVTTVTVINILSYT